MTKNIKDLTQLEMVGICYSRYDGCKGCPLTTKKAKTCLLNIAWRQSEDKDTLQKIYENGKVNVPK